MIGDVQELPPELRSIGIVHVSMMHSANGIPYLFIQFGGGFRHYGLYIGRPGFAPGDVPWDLYPWDDGVWYFDDWKIEAK